MKYFNKLYLLFCILVILFVSATNIRQYNNNIKHPQKLVEIVLASNPTKIEAFKAIYNFTDVGSYINKIKYDIGFKDDKDFLDEWYHEAIVETLEANNLPRRYYQRIGQAVNDEHLQSLVQWAKSDMIDEVIINYTLNPQELSVAVTLMHLVGDLKIVVAIFLLIVIYFLLKIAIKYLRKFYTKFTIKIQNASRKYRINKITEEELIRTNIKKFINGSEADELDILQNLINKSIANGDLETAEELLKILNKKKDEK